MRCRLSLALACILGNCIAETSQHARSAEFPSRDFIVARFQEGLPKGWEVLSAQEGAVPSDWFSLDRTGILIVASSGAARLSMCFVPRDWIGIRRAKHQASVDYHTRIPVGSDCKAITAAEDERTRDAVWRAMGLYRSSSIVNSGWRKCLETFPRDVWGEVDRKVKALVEKHCHSKEELDEAAISLVEFGIPAVGFFMERAKQGGKSARRACLGALGWLGCDEAEDLLSSAASSETDEDVVRSAKFALRQLMFTRAKRERKALPKGAMWPDGVEITYTPRRETFVLGEPIMVDFVLRNNSKKPVATSFGCDNRGSVRPLRFHFTATDGDGESIRDPFPPQYVLGRDRRPACPSARRGVQTGV